MNEVYEFLKKCGTYYLATVEGDQPRVRPFGTVAVFEGKLYIQTGKIKPVSKQLQANPNAEFIVLVDKVSVRCGGTVSFDVDDDRQRWIFDHNDVLRRLYDDYRQIVYFCLPVEQLEYYDLRPTPPIVLHANLNDGTVREGFKGGKFSI